MRGLHVSIQRLPVAAVLCFLALPASLSVSAETTMRDIIENVRRNEALYENVDVTMDYEYELTNGMMPTMPNGSIPVLTRIVTHYVSQDGMFRLDEEGESQTAEGPRNEDRISAFDGETTRLYEQNAIGNIIMGRKDDSRRIQPHILLLRQMFEERVPLSVFLSGHDAASAHPLGHLPDGAKLVASYDGMTEFEGLSCHAVAVVMYNRAGEPSCRHELLLAEERNYLPTRMHSYTFHLSKDAPIAEGILTELREVAPGVWYPHGARITSYPWTMTYTCESVSLEPNYPRSYFYNVAFPNGTAVYHLQDGKIIKSYRQGSPPELQAAFGSTSQRWLLWAGNGLVLVGVTIVLLKRRFVARGRQRSL